MTVFEWDDAKAEQSREKHGVSFDEAQTVFVDPLAIVGPDPDHSQGEEREIIVGHSAQGRGLLVSFTERSGAIRLISARLMTRPERKLYEEKKRR
ncbi:MAG: BrnT family toxin [Acidobacteriota bacterium]